MLRKYKAEPLYIIALGVVSSPSNYRLLTHLWLYIELREDLYLLGSQIKTIDKIQIFSCEYDGEVAIWKAWKLDTVFITVTKR